MTDAQRGGLTVGRVAGERTPLGRKLEAFGRKVEGSGSPLC